MVLSRKRPCSQMGTDLSPTSEYTTIIPLTFVVSLSVIREAYEDYHRHKEDSQVNARKVWLPARN